MKRIVICCDGTWNHRDLVTTNVARIAQAVIPSASDGTRQVVYYNRGVGTGWNRFDRMLGGMIGKGLQENVEDAYAFLVDNYEPGDEIYLFGFSRGAYTVRSVAGMVRKCGIVRKPVRHRVPQAYDIYHSSAHPSDAWPVDFRVDYAADNDTRESPSNERITFVGVWDTVGSLGVPGVVGKFSRKKYRFHDVKLSRIVEHAAQALAIDEERRDFEPAVWWIDSGDAQDVVQEWFPGHHSDIGGSSAAPPWLMEDPEEYTGSIGDVTFTWMRRKAAECGLEFDLEWVARNIKEDVTADLHPSRKGIWKLRPRYSRPIGRLPNDPSLAEFERNRKPGQAAISPQAISAAALQRAELIGYNPRNLAEYFAREGIIAPDGLATGHP